MTQLLIQTEIDPLLQPDIYEDETIKRDLIDMSIIQQNLLSYITNQQDTLNRIEDNIENTAMTVQHGLKDLEIANSYYFNYKSIIIGGVLGSLILSPISVLLGAKIGSTVTLSGALLGGFTGYNIQKI